MLSRFGLTIPSLKGHASGDQVYEDPYDSPRATGFLGVISGSSARRPKVWKC